MVSPSPAPRRKLKGLGRSGAPPYGIAGSNPVAYTVADNPAARKPSRPISPEASRTMAAAIDPASNGSTRKAASPATSGNGVVLERRRGGRPLEQLRRGRKVTVRRDLVGQFGLGGLQPAKACARSSMRSSGCSSPTDKRNRFCGVRVWGPSTEARCSIRLWAPPRLVARMKR